MPIALACSAFLANRIESALFVSVLSVLLLGLAVLVIFGPRPQEPGDAPAFPARRRALCLGGTDVGFISGTFAVGGGLLTVPYFQKLQHLGPHRAAAATAMAGSAAGAAMAVTPGPSRPDTPSGTVSECL